MGCFNMKCALTQLPITHGDDVVMLFGYRPGADELRRDYAGGFNYQIHHFKLVSTPIYGKYNDYGWVEDVDLVSARVNAVVLKTMGYDVEFDVNDAHWNDVIDDIGGADFNRWASKCSNDRFYDYTFVHRGAWDALLKESRKHTASVFYHFTLDEPALSSFYSMFACHGVRVRDVPSSRGRVHVFGSPHNVFAASLETLIADMRLPSVAANARMLEQCMRDIGMDKITAVLDKEPNDRTSDESKLLAECSRFAIHTSDTPIRSHPPLILCSRIFEWMGPLTDPSTEFGGNMMDEDSRKTWNLERAGNLIDLCASDIDVLSAMQDLHSIYSALCANQLTIRCQEDLPSQSQDATHWGTVAILLSTTDILYRHATKWDDWGDDEVSRDGISKQDVINEMAAKELDCSY